MPTTSALRSFPVRSALLALALIGASSAVPTSLLAALQLISVETTGVSSGAIFSVTATGLDAAAANTRFIFTTPLTSPVEVAATSSALVDARTGARRVSVRVPSGLPVGTVGVRLKNTQTAETLDAGTIRLLALSPPEPTSAQTGTTGLAVRLIVTGDSQFVANQTRVTFGAGVAVRTVVVESPTVVVATVDVAAGAAVGPRAVSLTSPRQSVVLADAFTVRGIAPNAPPVARIASVVAPPVGRALLLDGRTSSDPEGASLGFAWTIVSNPAGSIASITNHVQSQASLVPDRAGAYEIKLTVSDGTLTGEALLAFSTSNTAPSADAGPDQSVTVHSVVALSGVGSADVDDDPLTYEWSFDSVPAGSHTQLTGALSANPTFLADVHGSYVVRLRVRDGLAAASDTVVVRTSNSRPLANAGSDQTARVLETVHLTGAASTDADGDALTYLWSIQSQPAGSTATLIDATSVTPHFEVDVPGEFVLRLVVDDGIDASEPDTVMVSTANSAPIARAGTDQTVDVLQVVHLDGRASSDVDGQPLSFLWSVVALPAGSSATLTGDTTPQPTFVADRPGTYELQLIVNDGVVDSVPDTVVITTRNSRPVADAGPDQASIVSREVHLDGSGSSDVDGDALTFAWSLVNTPANSEAALADPTSVTPSFIVDRPGTYIAQLIVDDGSLLSVPDTVVITTQNSAPIARAGDDQALPVGAVAFLDGSGSSDADGDILSYTWSIVAIPAGSTTTLNDATSASPSLAIDRAGDYTLQLIVNDGALSSAPDTVTISTVNSAPVAKAGPDQAVTSGAAVALDGTASFDPDGLSLTYRWALTSRPLGSAATLSDASSATPTFDADLPGSYLAQLIVNDGVFDSAPDSVIIVASNRLPAADAGPDQLAAVGATVQLDGGASIDPDGQPLSYRWSLVVRPPASTATLSSAVVPNPVFVIDVPGLYRAQLVVNDGLDDSAADSIEVSTVNQPPVVNAGADQTLTLPARATLHGTAADDGLPNGVLTYQWSQVGGPGVTTFTNANGLETEATFTSPGTYQLRLAASDGSLKASDDLQMTVLPAIGNLPPVVSAGPDHTITLPTSATLTGTVYDDGLPAGGLLSGSWSLVSGPAITPTWLKTDLPAVLPPAVQRATSVHYDPGTNRLIVFGGTTSNPSNETWILSWANGLGGTPTWTKLHTTGAGPTRYSQSSYYDPGSNRLIVFGGIGPAYPHTNNDVWILTNANGTGGPPAWLSVTPDGTAPSPRFGSGLAYDVSSNRLFVLGGAVWASSGTYYYGVNDIWVLTNATGTGTETPRWIPISAAGTAPEGRYYSSVSYDQTSGRLIVFGGITDYAANGTLITRPFGDAWLLTGAEHSSDGWTWIQLTPDGGATSPAQRAQPLTAYNPVTNTLTIGLGAGNCNPVTVTCIAFTDVWSLKHANGLGGPPTWTQLAPDGGPPSAVTDSAYDSANDRAIGFSGTSNSTWILTNATNAAAGSVTLSSPTVSSPNVAGQVLLAATDAVFGAPGTYVLRLTGSDTELSASSDVTLTVLARPTLSQISLTPSPTAIINRGQTVQFSARGTFSDGSVQDPLPGAVWSSDDLNVAMIAADGLATGVGAGTAAVRAALADVLSAATILTTKPLPPTVAGPILAGATTVAGANAEPAATVQVFVNGAPGGAPVVADGSGQWVLSALTTTLITNDGVAASQTVNDVPSDLSGAVIVQPPGAQCVVPPPGLVGWWPANGNALDIRGGNHGTVVRSVTFEPGLVNQAFRFPGSESAPGPIPPSSTNYVDVPGAPALDMPGPFTIELWVRMNSLGNQNQQYLVLKDSEANEGQFHNYGLRVFGDAPPLGLPADAVGAVPRGIGFEIGDGTGHASGFYQVFSRTSLTIGDWYHIGAVYDGNNLRLYVNGNLEANQAIGPKTLFTTPASPLRIGIVRETDFWYPLDGQVDELSLYNRALTAAEIQAVHGAGSAGKCLPGGNRPPVVNAGPDQTVTLPASATLRGTATDDGLPNGVLTYQWSQVGGPAVTTFANANGLETEATFTAAGTYQLRLTASDGALTASDDVSVLVTAATNAPPSADAGPDLTTSLLASTALAGSAHDDGLPAGGVLRTTWTVVQQPRSGSVRFADAAIAATTAVFDRLGTYVLRLTADDGMLAASDEITVHVVCPAGPYPQDGIAVCDQFDRPDGPVSNGWRTWSNQYDPPATTIGIAQEELVTHGYPNYGGGVFRVAPVTLPVSFAFDLRPPMGIPPDVDEASWVIGFNSAPQASSALINNNTTPAQLRLMQFAGRRNVMREHWTGTSEIVTSSPNLPEPIQSQRRFAAGVVAHIEGHFASDLSGAVTVWHNDGLTPESTTFVFLPVAAPGSAPGGTLTFGNATGNPAEFRFDNLDVRSAFQPRILSVTPNSAIQGESITATILGQDTHFVQGTTRVDLGPGINTLSVLVTSPTVLSAQLRIEESATTGTRSTTVTTGQETVAAVGSFSVMPLNRPPVVSAGLDAVIDPILTVPVEWSRSSARISGGAIGTQVSAAMDLPTDITDPKLVWDSQLAFGGPPPTGRLWASWTAAPACRFPFEADVFKFHGTFTMPDRASTAGIRRVRLYDPFYETLVPGGTIPLNDAIYVFANQHFVVQRSGSYSARVAGYGTFGFDVASGSDVPETGWDVRTLQLPAGRFVAGLNQLDVVAEDTCSGGGLGLLGLELTLGNKATLSGAIVDDGVPSTAAALWSKVSGPGDVTFTDPHSIVTLVDFSTPGVYVLRLLADDTSYVVSDDVTVTVLAANEPPVVAQTTAGTTRVNDVFTLRAVGADDGLPAGAPLLINWTKVSGPGSVTFATPREFTTDTRFDTVGTYVIRSTVYDQQLSTDTDTIVDVVGANTALLVSVTPASGVAGTTLPVTVQGIGTHFVNGLTTLSLGSDVSVGSVTVTSATSLTATIAIDGAAAPGPRSATAVTGSETATRTDAFTIVAAQVAALKEVSPPQAPQGGHGPVGIVGNNTHFVQGVSQVSFGPDISVSNVQVTCPTCLLADLVVADDASVGPRTVSVATGSEVAALSNGFTVVAGTPILTSLSRASGQQGLAFPVTITGRFTHFAQGVTQVSLGTGVTVSSVTVTTPTALSAQVSIDPAATPGTRTLTVSTGTEVVSVPNVFTVLAAATLTQITITPSGSVTLTKGQTFQFSAQGTFSDGSVQDPLNGVVWTSTAPSVASVSGTGLATGVGAGTAGITASRSGIQSSATSFVVKPLPVALYAPITEGATTVDGALAEAGAAVQVFVNGVPRGPTTTADAAGSWAVSGLSPALLPGDSVIARQTVNGVTSDDSLPVIVTAGTPALVSVSPNVATAGQQHLLLILRGAFTHFAQNATQVAFAGTAVTVNAVTVLSPTLLSVNVSIAANAQSIPRSITVTTGAEMVILPNAFTVQPGVNQAPSITIAPSWAVTLPNRLLLTYTVTDDGLPIGGALTTSWDTVSGPGAVGYQSQTTNSISAGFAEAGLYTLRVTSTDTQFTVSQDVTVTVSAPAGGSALVAAITSPADGGEITGPVPVIGTAAGPGFASWTLEVRAVGDPAFRPLATGTAPVTDGVLGTLDTTLLLNGLTALQLRATDVGGQTATYGPIDFVVSQNQKVGNFTVSFNDLTVPVAGLPIQIVRTYDSRDRRRGDFGYGWRLDLKSVTVASNGPLGDGWSGTTSGGLFPTYCISPLRAKVVTVAFTDGTVYQFAPRLSPQCQQLQPPTETIVSFTPMSTTPPNVSLEVVGNATAYIPGPFPGFFSLMDLDEVSTFEPTGYRLTLPDGRTLVIDARDGLQSMSDLNGNTLTISASGVLHSSGRGVTFQRDSSSRITRVTDPAGNFLTYTYDGAGDLAEVTDTTDNATTFTYNAIHGLLAIQDPRGIQPIRNVYDDSGRLIQHIDAFGNTITYGHDLGSRQEIVTDRLNRITVNEYDERGNVVRVTDAQGGVTTRTYDTRNNMLTETDALGRTRAYTYDAFDNRLTERDALGHTTAYTYNARNQVLTIRDPRGGVTTNAYDSAGNLLATTDALGQTTTYAYNARGQQTSARDPLGHTTTSHYDSVGNLTQQTDALGRVTSYTYDATGNRLTETRTRTTSSGPEALTTQFEYDAQNRVTRTILPDGSSTRTVYDAIGKQSSTFDQLGRETRYEYDLMGRLTRTLFPDGTSESSAYDAEGRRLSSTDRAGRETRYAYDALGRLTQTTYPDGTNSRTEYDAAGQVRRTLDARNNATTFSYDDGGRRTGVTDALGHLTAFQYDAAGNQVRVQDANASVTQYEYDALNRRTRTVYADSTNDTVTYDALGRMVSKTDQAGIVTKYEYDALGRLTAVVDALNQRTSYAYDEVGNRISQTDAKGRTTTFGYDKMGRRTARTLPLGMTERSTYGASGTLASKTDFNGRTTTYAYDLMNRLTAKVPDPALAEPTVQFSYSTTGQRTQMVDASGTTTYAYDTRDRLLMMATPQGTLTYTYNAVGSLASIRSSNTGGTTVDYAYDSLNRLSTATDNRLSPGVTTYSYDAIGNLASYTYPNGVTHAYTYNSLNRLTNLGVTTGRDTLATFVYTMGPSGNRTRVVELGGRQVDYGYDALYRLTTETIANATPAGTTTYAYDQVGNRQWRSSLTTGLTNYAYDDNDRLTTDTYNDNGNTIASAGATYAYDFENRLTSQNNGAVTIVYDGDGNRVAKTVGGVTTRYLVDDRNLTGYAQVLEEVVGGAVQRAYTYGLDLISQMQASGTSFYGYDGHGSVRLLADTSGSVTDRYSYDAFGINNGRAGSTTNNFLYSGEQHETDLSLYYLRARYFDAHRGRFVTGDPIGGSPSEPLSLHRYLFANDDPIMLSDPSGEFAVPTVPNVVASSVIISVLSTVARLDYEAVYKGKFFTAREVLWEVGISASAGALAGGSTILLESRAIGFQAARYLKPVLKRMVEKGVASGTSAAVERVTGDLLRFAFLREPVEFVAKPGQLLEASFGSFVLGGMLVRVTPAARTYDVQGFGRSYREVLVSYDELAGGLGTTFSVLGDFFTAAVTHESLHEYLGEWLQR